MNGDEEGALSLTDVSARFLEAEAKLHDLASAAQALTTESTQLADVRASVHLLAVSTSEVTTNLQYLVGDLRVATQTIQKTDPATVLSRLDALDAKVSSHTVRLDTIQESDQVAQKSIERLEQRVLASLKGVRTLVFVAIAAAVVAAVLAALPL